MTPPAGSLGSLAQQWRARSEKLQFSGPHDTAEWAVLNDCADQLDACRGSLGSALWALELEIMDLAPQRDLERALDLLAEVRTRIG